MTVRSGFNIKSLFLFLLILAGLDTVLLSQDKKISNTINLYRHVEAIGTTPHDNVTLSDVSGLNPGDTVLLIQMKGANIIVDNDPNYSTQAGYFGAPGVNEFLIIESIVGSIVTFTSNILNNYSVDGLVQLIRVPYYNTAAVTSTLTCQPWDSISKTGGVLAMIIGRTLSLEADIDVSGKGFKGGEITLNTVGACGDATVFSYDYSFGNAGNKGEGVANRGYVDPDYPPLFPLYSKGRGANLTGGGGGNGKYSGGGGGSNWGAGGKGGRDGCLVLSGGLDGKKIKSLDIDFYFDNNMFMGGGGGGSTHESAGSPSSTGAKGGGIVIIICDTLKGNGKIITADGGTPNTAPSVTGNAGAGGGGGGGSIALYLQSYSSGITSGLTLSVKGGKGGNTTNNYGEGGGGGGGLILTNNLSKPSNVSKIFTGGALGSSLSTSGSSGSLGDTLNTYSPTLNGFLYNSIRSAVTGNQVDSICSNMSFGVISGTIPFSGTIQWQSSTTSESAGFSDISGATSKDYTPGLLTLTTWFRRVVTDAGPPVIIDISKPVKIIVQPFIKDNTIGDPDTVCYARDPKALISRAALLDGNGIYSFRWKVSTDSSLFTRPANNDSTESYTPEPALKLTSWYKRTVTSGRCIDSSAIVRINVLDTISNNIILNTPQDICYGTTFTDLTATTTVTTPALSGGDATYRFLWESSINGVAWGPAPGTNNQSGYMPAELPERAPLNEYIFRRVVKSGMDDVCVSTSPLILLRDYPVITNNMVVTAEQKVCSGFEPVLLTGSDPLNGNGTYTYIWQDSSKGRPVWTDITGATQRDYQPPILTDTTRYRRKVFSSACENISKSVRINVHKPLSNNSISLVSGGIDTTICDGANPNRLPGTLPAGGTNLPGDYAYEWLSSIDNTTFNPVITAGTSQTYDPPALNVTTYFRRKVLSGSCIDISTSTVKITVLPLISNNTLNDPAVICKDYVPALLTGATPAGGDGNFKYFWEQSIDAGTTWITASGVNNDPSGNYQPPALGMDTKYKRKVISGANDCCTSLSNIVEVKIHTVPSSSIYAGPDTVLYSFDNYYKMRASPYFPYETAKWTIIAGTGDFDNDTKSDAQVSNLSPKLNSFLWTVTNGPCILKDSVDISVMEIKIPDGFSPNNDGVNDLFEILGLDTDNQEVELSIVNSAGTEVFYSTNKNNQTWSLWDGKTSKGADLPEGTYYFILKMESKFTDVSPYKESGFIVLKRR
jgi:gliding motility-associated-like protein